MAGKIVGEDFASAAGRHLDDCERLLRSGRHDNAAYLAGYVVECSLKAVVESGGLSAVSYGHDLTTLSGSALDLAYLLTPSVWRYQTARTPEANELHAKWRPERRYWRTGEVDEATACRFLAAADATYAATTVQTILDGRGRARR